MAGNYKHSTYVHCWLSKMRHQEGQEILKPNLFQKLQNTHSINVNWFGIQA